jgi:diphosphomevalonate decarboxylase
VTLAQSDLRTHTTASCSASYSAPNTLTLNSEPSDLTTPRPAACLSELRRLRANLESSNSSLPKLSNLPLRIVSENNFPTAAGLASSAAGFAALVRAVADLYELPQGPEELSVIARQGSGSACRSLLGGYVAWDMGKAEDGIDSRARVVAPASHWPEMRAIILVASDKKKDVGSTTGMQATVATSKLFNARANEVVPREMEAMEKAIAARDFESFGTITMRDSNSFHATCLDTTPPIFYLTDVSRAAIRAVEGINAAAGKLVAAYTFDAGPNAVIYYLSEHENVVAGMFKSFLSEKDGWESGRGQKVQAFSGEPPINKVATETLKTGISRVILTGVGEGPVKVQNHLIGERGETLKSS